MNPPTKNMAEILLVDDRKENLTTLEALLANPELDIYTAQSGNQALGLMLEHDFALVLLDVQMPGMDGFEVAELMRAKEKTKHVPIIFVTALSKNDHFVFKGYEVGAVDYLNKPLEPVILKSKVDIFLRLNRRKQELEAAQREIELSNHRLKELSVRDGLTGLYNHRHFHELLNREFFQARRNQFDLACFMIDLDYFKDVNDTFGHIFGDFVLSRFARLIHGLIRNTDILSRYGGEEFVLLLPHTNLEGARILAEKFRYKAAQYVYRQDGHSKRVTISIGIATFEAHTPKDPFDLVTFADKALYSAKTEGRNRVNIYNEKVLTESGTLKRYTNERDGLSELHDHITKILDKTQEFALNSLIGLSKNPPDRDLNGHRFVMEHNSRSLEILDLMAQRLGLPRPLLLTFKRASKFHDLFKIYLKDMTPLKNGPLDEEESLGVKDYPFMLEQLTRRFDLFKDERTILLYHHEHYDGTGYPEGLAGDQLPQGARLFALVDAFVSMTSPRNYKPQLSPEQVIKELIRQAGKQFDPILVDHLLEIITDNRLLPVSAEEIDAAKENEEL